MPPALQGLSKESSELLCAAGCWVETHSIFGTEELGQGP